MDELNESVGGSIFEYFRGNMKILKIVPKHRIRERNKMCGFLVEMQQLRKRCKFQESIVAAKIEYNFGNIDNCENRSTTAKKRHSKNAYKTCRF